jgi:glycosyltransferase involved in cell wall biosynthesis
MHLFTVSNFIKNELHTIYNIPLNKIDITYNGICSYFLDNGNVSPIKKKVILAVGSFNKRKNQQMLINGFIASQLYNEYQLVLFGDKSRVFAATNFNEEHLKKYNILITNSFSDEVLMQYYKDAALVVSLSTYEGFGIPVLEGLYFHSKVLCSDIPVYRELFKNIAFYCNPNDEADVSIQLKHALMQTVDSQTKMLAQLIEKYNYPSSAKVILNRINQQL